MLSDQQISEIELDLTEENIKKLQPFPSETLPIIYGALYKNSHQGVTYRCEYREGDSFAKVFTSFVPVENFYISLVATTPFSEKGKTLAESVNNFHPNRWFIVTNPKGFSLSAGKARLMGFEPGKLLGMVAPNLFFRLASRMGFNLAR